MISKHFFLWATILLVGATNIALANNKIVKMDNPTQEEKIKTINARQIEITKRLSKVTADVQKNKVGFQKMEQECNNLSAKVDSLYAFSQLLGDRQITDRSTLNRKIYKAMSSSQLAIANRTTWGIAMAAIIVVLLVIVVYFILKCIKRGDSSIETTIGEVRKAQDSLQAAQTKLQENSIQLDNKLLEIVQRQMDAEREKPTTPYTAPDHSLVLKVADEIVKIELNMSRMDSTVKGYKQLKKAVERIKDNFKANGYEFVEMLGMPYNEGMKVTASFVSDESLEPGKQIISGITKPQINYNGRMIQAAQITVSQNI